LEVHPFVEAYLTKGIFSPRMKWLMKYKQWIKINAVPAMHLVQSRFLNTEQEEIQL